MKTNKDYYAILGVLPTAEDIVISAVYKALALRYHPDKFMGKKEDATIRMAELNEAYEILSDPLKRQKYDENRGKGTQNASSYFDGESNDVQPEFDPLERDWEIAVSYLPDLKNVELHLNKISWRLANSFRAYLLETKLYDKYKEISDKMESDFLQIHFGTNFDSDAMRDLLEALGGTASFLNKEWNITFKGKSYQFSDQAFKQWGHNQLLPLAKELLFKKR
jgi:curved DNA-binding protein CbpA